MDKRKYCSIDLEFTGFNPEVDQILEIGFVFFEISEQGIIETEKWSQIFQPTIEVHEKILGLTGLTLDDLAAAPLFSTEHREFLQQKLGEATLVAHNPALDVRFMETYGLKLSGNYIDTLDIAQILLPTHHSYNLENLIHYFAIPSANSHRALDDSLATLELLKKLLGLFYGYELELQTELLNLASKTELSWVSLLKLENFPKELFIDHQRQTLQYAPTESIEIHKNTVVQFGMIKDLEQKLAYSLSQSDERSVLVVESKDLVLQLWKSRLGQALFAEEDIFSQEKFDNFINNASTADEIKFAMKVLVWLRTNWQTETILDLNLSFFGGQFRSYIVGAKQVVSDEQLLICSYSDLTRISNSNGLSNRNGVIMSLAGLEKYFSSGNSRKASWNMALYLLRSVYNPESGFGREDLKTEITEAIAASDLFFGLMYLLLHRHFPSKRYVKVEDIISDDYLFKKLQNMIHSYAAKLTKVTEKTEHPTLQNLISEISNSLTLEEGIIKWVEVSEYNTTFKNQPLELASETKKYLSTFDNISFVERFSSPEWLTYLCERLGLSLEIQKASEFVPIPCEIKTSPQAINQDWILNSLDLEHLPSVVLFDDPKAVKKYYDGVYSRLSEYSNVLAQGYSGGPNKLFRNFAIKDNSVLLITSEMLIKQNRNITVKSCLVESLPEYDYHHPYNSAVIEHSQTDSKSLILTLRQGRFLQILNSIASEKLDTILVSYKPNDEQLVQRLNTFN